MGKRIIACLDWKDGQVVKGINFKGLRKIGDPIEIAKEYEKQGVNQLVFLDISATSTGRGIMLEELKRIASAIKIPLIAGGGINNLEAIQEIFSLGVNKISINTAAVKDPSFLKKAVKTFGGEKILVAIDAGKKGDSWEVMVEGGERETGLDVLEWAREVSRIGVKEILLTSMDGDGKKEGYDNQLNQAVHRESSLSIIASGGAGHPRHLYDALTIGDANAVLLASILHEKEYTIPVIREYLIKKGVVLEDVPRLSL